MKISIKHHVVRGVSSALAICAVTTANANGLQAELRSSTSILPVLPPGMATPTAPAGGVIIGAQPWIADAAQGFTPVLDVDAVVDPLLALSTSGLHLPILLLVTQAPQARQG